MEGKRKDIHDGVSSTVKRYTKPAPAPIIRRSRTKEATDNLVRGGWGGVNMKPHPVDGCGDKVTSAVSVIYRRKRIKRSIYRAAHPCNPLCRGGTLEVAQFASIPRQVSLFAPIECRQGRAPVAKNTFLAFRQTGRTRELIKLSRKPRFSAKRVFTNRVLAIYQMTSSYRNFSALLLYAFSSKPHSDVVESRFS